ncbi:hypothetical protein [Actinokineospora sp. NBRC 105648]|nr:hypothetical protein [Actinokineospora sp. NBRC 105648]
MTKLASLRMPPVIRPEPPSSVGITMAVWLSESVQVPEVTSSS